MIGDAFKTLNICSIEETQNHEDEKGGVDPQQIGKGCEEALQNVRDVAKVEESAKEEKKTTDFDVRDRMEAALRHTNVYRSPSSYRSMPLRENDELSESDESSESSSIEWDQLASFPSHDTPTVSDMIDSNANKHLVDELSTEDTLEIVAHLEALEMSKHSVEMDEYTQANEAEDRSKCVIRRPDRLFAPLTDCTDCIFCGCVTKVN
eukprot:225286_1